jgi:hypothetical protein
MPPSPPPSCCCWGEARQAGRQPEAGSWRRCALAVLWGTSSGVQCRRPPPARHACFPHSALLPTHRAPPSPSPSLLLTPCPRVGQKIGAAKVPGHAEYADFMATTFMQTYIKADGGWGAAWVLWGARLCAQRSGAGCGTGGQAGRRRQGVRPPFQEGCLLACMRAFAPHPPICPPAPPPAAGTWGIVKTAKGMRRPSWSQVGAACLQGQARQDACRSTCKEACHSHPPPCSVCCPLAARAFFNSCHPLLLPLPALQWGNLRYASNAAFVALLRAQQLPAGSAVRAPALPPVLPLLPLLLLVGTDAEAVPLPVLHLLHVTLEPLRLCRHPPLSFSCSLVPLPSPLPGARCTTPSAAPAGASSSALARTRHSGWAGAGAVLCSLLPSGPVRAAAPTRMLMHPPLCPACLQPHHRGASCPNRPAACGQAQFSAPGPNPQVLFGALVAGPAGPGDDTYRDARDDYVSNEVAIDYNAGWTGALAGLLHLAA